MVAASDTSGTLARSPAALKPTTATGSSPVAGWGRHATRSLACACWAVPGGLRRSDCSAVSDVSVAPENATKRHNSELF